MKRVLWKRVCAAVQGRSHASERTPCQDSVATTYRRNVYAIALSDGAGSARLSHYGSQACTHVLCATLSRHFDDMWRMDADDAGAKLVWTLRERFASKAKELDVEPTDLAATALAVAVKRNRFIAAHLGDGAIGVELTGTDGIRELKTLSAPDNGEHSNETYFVTSDSAVEHIKIITGTVRGQQNTVVSGFILMSDGPEAALYRKADCSLAPACQKLLDAGRTLDKKDLQAGLENTLGLIAHSKTHDDCSIALLTHVGSSAQKRK